MAVNPENVDLTHVTDVSDIKPAPTLALKDGGRFHVGPLGDEGKLLMSEDEPGGTRVFDRVGVGYTHAEWNGWDLFWADDDQELVDALRSWNAARSMG